MILVARRADALKKATDACFAAHRESGLQQGGKFVSVVADVSDKAQVASLFDTIPQDLQDVDVLGIVCTLSIRSLCLNCHCSQQCRICPWRRARWRYC